MQIVLFGSGTVGRYISRWLTQQGTPAVCFADNDDRKWNTVIEGVGVQSPESCRRTYPDATWIATVLHTPYPEEIQAEIAAMGVKTEPLTNYLSVKRQPLNWQICHEVAKLCEDRDSQIEMWDQHEFRLSGNSSFAYRDISHLYFEDFIKRIDGEHFVDCGANDGDSIDQFMEWSGKFREISAYEPDPKNYAKLKEQCSNDSRITIYPAAVSDHEGTARFSSTGDQTAHLGAQGDIEVALARLDTDLIKASPTFIKMDIEGAELEGLWGARQTIAKYSPVLAVCAYHTDDHIWQIPLLIHAINPGYKLYLRRYLEQPWEMVWYAVPAERVK